MKGLLLLLIFFVSNDLKAQLTTQEMLQKKMKERGIKPYPYRIPNASPFKITETQKESDNLYSSKKPGVYALPGGMPCIVPDTQGIAAIPNAFSKGPFKTTIPNASPIIPQQGEKIIVK